MPITEHQRQQRRKHLGSSDMAAVLGIDPYRTAGDVWLEKTGRAEPFEGNAATELGNLLEDGVLDYAAEQLGPIKRNQYRSNPACHLGANIDAIATDTGEPIDAKVSGVLRGWADREAWGEDGSDQVPEPVIVQTHVHMLCLDGEAAAVERAHVPALLGGRGLAMFHVPRNAALCDLIASAAERFWRLVDADTPPEDAPPSLETLQRCRRVEGRAVDLDPALVRAWDDARQTRLDAEKAEKRALAAVLDALGDAETGAAAGVGTFSYRPQTRRYIDSTRLRHEHPDIAAAVTATSTYRVARLKAEPAPGSAPGSTPGSAPAAPGEPVAA